MKRLVGGEILNELFAIHDRHIDVRENDVYPFVAQQIESFLAISRLVACAHFKA